MDELEFRRLWKLSLGFHVAGILIFSILSSRYHSSLFDSQENHGALNIMWATTVQSPPETKANKLPGPEIQVPELQPSKGDEKKMAVGKNAKPLTLEEARKKAMAEAIASVQGRAEKKPIPNINNYSPTEIK